MNNTNKTTKSELYRIDPRNIVVVENFNCRCSFGDIDALAEEIRAQGVLNPITVIPFTDDNNQEKYRLVDGERRYRAVMKLLEEGEEIARIPALFVSKSLTDEELLVQQALRNEGKTFTPYEWGMLELRLKEKCGLTITEISKKLGRNAGSISRDLSYLELIPELQQMLKDEIVSGPTLDRVLKTNNGDQNITLDILKRLNETRDENKTISLRSFNKEPQQVLKKETAAIAKGLDLFFKYYGNAQKENGVEIVVDLHHILELLNNGKTINEVFDQLRDEAYNERKAE